MRRTINELWHEAHQRLGELSLSLNRFVDAMKQYRLMDEIIEKMAKASPSDVLAQFRLARTRRQLGFVAVTKLGESEQGQKYLREAIKINRECIQKKPDDDVFKHASSPIRSASSLSPSSFWAISNRPASCT